MKLSLLEQETVLLYNQAESAAEVYTHDPKLMKKLEQLAEKYPEQIEISRYYEKLPKPTLIATQEYLEGKIHFRNPSKDKNLD